MNNFPVDAVITWVDGNDPLHKQKRLQYATFSQISNDEVGGDIRFTSIGEIKYAVASLLRFAPFLRKIYIVTDNQNPQIDSFITKNFPNKTTQIEIIDHKVLFRGNENVLPIFNSLSIETVLWRIPDLSEHFIYLNDDFMVVSPTTIADYFDEKGSAICYAKPFSVLFAAFLRYIKPKRHGFKIFGFKDAMLNAAQLLGEKKWFPYIGHIPLALRKSVLEKFYTENPSVFYENYSPRFRESHQHNPQVLCYLLGLQSGDVIMKDRKGVDLYLKAKEKVGYMQNKLSSFDKNSSAKFLCLNSLDYASADDQQLAMHWLQKRLSVEES